MQEEPATIRTYENINWNFEYTIFKIQPEISNIYYPIVTKKPNEVKFIMPTGYKSIETVIMQSVEYKMSFINKLFSILTEIERQGYRVYNFDLAGVVANDKDDPCIMLFFPVYSIKDSKDIVKDLDGFIKTDANNGTNSIILAEIFGEMFFSKLVKKIKDRKLKIKIFKEKMHETACKKYLRDFYNWYKKSILNKYSLTDSYEGFKKAFEKMCERNQKKKTKIKNDKKNL